MISEIRLRNFKCFAEAAVPLSVVTLLIGQNGSGKSSIVHGLAVLKQSSGNSNLNLTGPILDLGGFSDVLHQGAPPDAELQVGISGLTQLRQPVSLGHGESRTVAFDCTWGTTEGALSRIEVLYKINGDEISARWVQPSQPSITPTRVEVRNVKVQFGFSSQIGTPIRIASIQAQADSDPPIQAQVQQSLDNMLKSLPEVISRFFFVPAMRGTERQSYDLAKGPSIEWAAPGGSLEQAEKLTSTLAYRRELEDRISSWLRRITNRVVRARLLPPRRVALETATGTSSFNIVNEGFGSNQLIYILAQLAVLPEDSVLGIEEPETHLHPAAQTALVDVLIEALREGKKQLILTTHSEHILYAFMASVAEGRMQPEELRIHYLETKDGDSACRTLDLDSSGRVLGGLPGFFDVHIQEFRRQMDAAEKRR